MYLNICFYYSIMSFFLSFRLACSLVLAKLWENSQVNQSCLKSCMMSNRNFKQIPILMSHSGMLLHCLKSLVIVVWNYSKPHVSSKPVQTRLINCIPINVTSFLLATLRNDNISTKSLLISLQLAAKHWQSRSTAARLVTKVFSFS
jgi:hypothetical protein